MTRDGYQRAKAVFLAVCELSPDERPARVLSMCGGDEDLRATVEAMLEADAHPGGLDVRAIRERVGAIVMDAEAESPEQTPVRVGRYRVVRRLAAGGMGAVYEAEQDDPRRRVALKVIRPGLASPGVEQRFRREAQLLARLRHPGIAQVHDAGLAPVELPTGALPRQPFIVMELIEGDPLDAYAHRAGLSTRERLRLLADVCDAVEHAHRHGVVHRDLKPANILVDADGRPKIVDFGVARLVDPDAATMTVHTAEGVLVGTLAYMSPEQAHGRPGSVDGRSDIYALGVVLYELLGGRRPHDVGGMGLPEAARLIREEEPTRLGAIDTRLRGDVETIAAKALEKEPARRYASAAAMAGDIRRHLENQPIAARPPSALYQLRKFARRNRALVGGAAAVFLVLAAATPYSLLQARDARTAQRRAEAREREARLEAAKFAEVNAFLQSIFDLANPERSPAAGEATVRDLLDLAAARIDGGSLGRQPGVEVATRTTIGNAYRSLSLLGPAESMLRAAVETGNRIYPDGHADLAQAMNKLARTLQDAGEYNEAEALFVRTLEMRRRLLPPDHADIAVSLNNLAHTHTLRGRLDEALAMHEEALAMRRRVLGNDDTMVANSLNNIGVALYRMGRIAEAADAFAESLEIDRAARGDHPNIAGTMGNLAVLRRMLGDLDGAERLIRESLAMRRGIYGESHPTVANGLLNLGDVLLHTGRPQEAVDALRRALRIEEETRGADHPTAAVTCSKLAAALTSCGAHAEAVERARTARRVLLGAMGPEHQDSVRAGAVLVEALTAAGRLDEAGDESARLLEEAATLPGPRNPRAAEAALARARWMSAAGDVSGGAALAAEAAAALEAAYGVSSPDAAAARAFAEAMRAGDRARADR